VAVIPIRCVPDPVLRQKAKRITIFSDRLQKLVDDMIETLHDANGMGLAAPQVGVSLRLVVLQPPDHDLLVLINPEVVKKSGERNVTEGCLSIPGYQGEIKRAVSVIVKGRDRHGKQIRVKAANDYLEQALEHEIEHLDGVLYTDHLESPDNLRKLELKPQTEEPKE
jgi:peptide deformylase